MSEYRIVSGIRFQKGIPQEEIDQWNEVDGPEKFRNRYVPGEFYLYEDTDLCFLEYRMNVMLTDVSRRPLTPYSILAGKRTAEDLATSGRKKVHLFDGVVVDPKKNFSGVLGRKNNGGSALLTFKDNVRKDFFEWMYSVEEQWGIRHNREDDLLEFFCEFGSPDFNKRTSRIILPELIVVNYLPLPSQFSGKIWLKEVLIGDREDFRSIIDNKGWWIDFA